MDQSSEPATAGVALRDGVYYVSGDGVGELPLVDVTNPAFTPAPSESEQRELLDAFLRAPAPFAKLPAFLRRPLLRVLLRGSRLARAVQSAEGTFLSGMSTYLLKLPPELLPPACSTPLDRKIASALPSLAVRWRLADMARLAADALAPLLGASSSARPLHVLNIAGGPALDSLNALLLLQREHPSLLAARAITLCVLDPDDDGPRFGARALSALKSAGLPLAGRELRFEHVRYDWSAPAQLSPLIQRARSEGALVLAQSEGGLFEYGTDRAIHENLSALRELGPELRVVGSVTRADEPTRRLRRMSAPATRPRGLELFTALTDRASFVVERAIERPFSDHVVLRPR